MQSSVVLVLYPGFEEIEAFSPIDILRRAGVSVTIASLTDSLQVKSAQGVIVKADVLLADASAAPSCLVVPGGPGNAALNDRHLPAVPLLHQRVADQMAAGRLLAMICAAPMQLSKLGLFGGRRMTCYPGCSAAMLAVESPPCYVCDRSVVEDGNLITSRGPGTAFAFGLAIAARLAGAEKAAELAKGMIYSA
jgi:DJ-1 family protein